MGGLEVKSQFYILVAVTIVLVLSLIALAEDEQTASETYYGRLKSLVTRRHIFAVRPESSERDLNLIEAEKGAAGVLFGSSMDDVIAIWGKPNAIRIDGITDVWDLGIGACRFSFVDNRLVGISLHSATLKDAHLANGIGFKSSYDEVKAAFSEPLEASDFNLVFLTENDYRLRFHFVADTLVLGKRKLICIEISRPGSGRGTRMLRFLDM